MATDLERFRDHARKMADGKRPARLEGPDVALTDADRALWGRLAGEADAFLAREAEAEAGPVAEPEVEDVPLFV